MESNWPAVLSLAMGIFRLVVAEYLPASLLTPMADALAISEGQGGQGVTATPTGATVRLTVSIGLAQRHDRATHFDAILNAADRAMYAAKQSGRNQVAVNRQPYLI